MLWRQAAVAMISAFKNKLVLEVETSATVRHAKPIVELKDNLIRITFPDQNPLLETESAPKPCDGTLKRCVFPEYPTGKSSGR